MLISEATNHLAADTLETREIDSVVVVGKTEPQRIFELLGRKGEVARERLALRDAYVEALDAIDARIGRRRLLGSRIASPLSHATRRASYSSNASLSSALPPHVPSGALRSSR